MEKKRSKNYKNYRGNSRIKGTRKESDEQDSKGFSKLKESANDPEWYYYSEQSLNDAGRFSFNNALGVAVPMGESKDFTVPGIMNIYTVPSPGVSYGNSDGVNLAAKNLYSYVRHANSGHTNYDSPDLMMYILAMDSLYSMYAWMTRIYGLARIYIQQNRYWGATMLRSMGLNADDFARNLAQFRTFINQYAIKLSAFSVPATMSMFKRHIWMYSNVFADEDDPKASVYMYQPAYLLLYDEVNGKLTPHPITCSHSTTNGIGHVLQNINGVLRVQNMAETLLKAVVASESMNIMSGDILKAYGAENCWKFTAIGDDYAILPLFSEEVLGQIHNTKFVGNFPVAAAGDLNSSLAALEVYQNTTPGYGAILYTPVFRGMALADLSQIFDTWHRTVDPKEVFTGSRNMVAGQVSMIQASDSNYYAYTILGTCGSDICLFATIWMLDGIGNLISTVHYDTSQQYSNMATALTYISKESRFNEAPLGTRWVHVEPSTGVRAVNPQYITGEISNYTVMDIDDLMKLHDASLLTMLAVPFLGNAVKK